MHPIDFVNFSIVITNYNYGRFLADCIDSALGQTVNEVEVIIVDDGSTDESHEILKAYSETCQIVFQEQAGQAAAMKAGFQLCRGEYVLFLDADDLLYPNAMSVVRESIGTDLVAKVHFAMDVINRGGEVIGQLPEPNQRLSSGDLTDELLATGTYVFTPCSGNVYARSVLERIMPEWDTESYRICADLYLLVRCIRYGEVYSVEEPLGAYRLHGDNAHGTTSILEFDRERLKRRIDALENKLALLREESNFHGESVTKARWWNWVGVYGCKDWLIAMKCYPELLPPMSPPLLQILSRFVLLALQSRKASTLDKSKAGVFALLALCPSQVMKGVSLFFIPKER